MCHMIYLSSSFVFAKFWLFEDAFVMCYNEFKFTYYNLAMVFYQDYDVWW